MKNLTLVIMAAGMGSRFGGLKQIEPVGPNGEIIADYSVYDAIRAGFTKVIFIIRESNLTYFQNNICNKFADKIKVEYAFQELSKIPSDVKLPAGREKMLGTGHALYCAAPLIDSDFVLINADDFYGFDSYRIAKNFFTDSQNNRDYLSVNYPFITTSSPNGSVKRGVVFTDNFNYIKDNIESEISFKDGKFIAKSLVDNKEFVIREDHPVTVNFFGLRQDFLDILKEDFNIFIHSNINTTSEFLLPEVIKKAIFDGKIKMQAKTSKSQWLGITYQSDLPELKNSIQELIKKGEYPEKLWD